MLALNLKNFAGKHYFLVTIKLLKASLICKGYVFWPCPSGTNRLKYADHYMWVLGKLKRQIALIYPEQQRCLSAASKKIIS
jgi:hypothetical protein